MKEKQEQILKLWQSGMQGIHIAEQVGVSRTTVYRVLDRAGIDTSARSYTQARKLDDAQVGEIVRRYEAGEQSTRLAEEFKVSTHTVLSRLKEAGVEIRPKNQDRVRVFSEEEIKGILENYSSGFTQEQIAREYKTSQISISRILISRGVETTAKRALRKGGRHVVRNYVFIRPGIGDDAFLEMVNTSGYILEHRLIMARHLGRPLLRTETVHHIDGDTLNNEVENLQIRQGRHGRGVVYRCLDCGSHNVKTVELD